MGNQVVTSNDLSVQKLEKLLNCSVKKWNTLLDKILDEESE